MGSLRRLFEFATRACIPLCGAPLRLRSGSLDAHRRPQTFWLRDQSLRKASTRQACKAKNSHRFANVSPPLPERHEGFAWASLSRAKSRGLPMQKVLLSVYVCVCLWLTYIQYKIYTNRYPNHFLSDLRTETFSAQAHRME